MPPFYPRYSKYYSYELPRLASFPLIFTYRRIWVLTLANHLNSVASSLLLQHQATSPCRTGGATTTGSTDNLVYTRKLLQTTLPERVNCGGEHNAEKIAYTLLPTGDSSKQLGSAELASCRVVKLPCRKDAASLEPSWGPRLYCLRYLSPRLTTITARLSYQRYIAQRRCWLGSNSGSAGTKSLEETTRRTRSTIYPDSVGIGHCD